MNQVFSNRKLSDKFLSSLTLGEKDSKHHFVGDITRVNIWSKIFDNETMQALSHCGYSEYDEMPDILNWDEVKVTVNGDIIVRDVEEYPCANADNNIHDVLMPVPAKSMYEAITNCKTLGGKLLFPSEEKEVLPFVELVKSKLGESKCDNFIWANYIRNSYDGDNWTLYENASAYSKPPFHYPGWLEFAVGQPNGRGHDLCAGIDLDPEEPVLLHDLACETKGYCYVCRFGDSQTWL